MGMTIEKTIKNGVDLIDVFKEHFPSEKAIDTIGELVEIAKKYQKIVQIMERTVDDGTSMYDTLQEIEEVIEDGNDDSIMDNSDM